MTKPQRTEFEKIILGCIESGTDSYRGVPFGMRAAHPRAAITRLEKKGFIAEDKEESLSACLRIYRVTTAGAEVLKEVRSAVHKS